MHLPCSRSPRLAHLIYMINQNPVSVYTAWHAICVRSVDTYIKTCCPTHLTEVSYVIIQGKGSYSLLKASTAIERLPSSSVSYPPFSTRSACSTLTQLSQAACPRWRTCVPMRTEPLWMRAATPCRHASSWNAESQLMSGPSAPSLRSLKPLRFAPLLCMCCAPSENV